MSQRTCATCGEMFPVRDKRMVYCSKSCAAKACYRRKMAADPLPLSTEFTCARCGEFVPAKKKTGPPAKYCSSRCREAANYVAAKARGTRYKPPLKPQLAVVCAQCLTGFESSRSDARFCSQRCLSAWGRSHEKGKCSIAECDRPIRAKGMCSKHYKATMRADGRLKNPPWDDKAKARWRARKERMRGDSDAETFSFHEVFDRDGWVCGICSGPVDPDLKWPDPLSVSLDHIVPVSRGGKHRRDNAQCSHLRCNVSKGAAA